MESLSKKNIIAKLEDKNIKVDVLDSVNSTNDYFEDVVNSTTPIVCVADYQTKGRGRLQRKWYSPKGENINMSVLYRFYRYTNQLSGLSLATGLAVREAIMQVCNIDEVSMKWPNDIVLEGSKLGGVLIETKSIGRDFYAVVGVGVNVNMEEVDSEIPYPWTSIYKSAGVKHQREPLIAAIVNNLVKYYKKLERGGFSQFASEWEKCDVLKGRNITIAQGNKIFEGLCVGVDEGGRLSLRTDSGVMFFNYGEVTTR